MQAKAERATATAPRQLVDIDEAARRLAVGRTKIYDLIGSGRLRSMKLGRRRLVSSDSIDDLIAEAEAEGAL